MELFVPDQDTLEVLARLAAEGIYDPQNHFLPRTSVGGGEDVASPEAERRFLRYFWAALADWRPERRNLLLAAKAGGDIVGVQEIGASHFAMTRTVSTGSWTGRRYQRAGYGKAMREAVLHLAFDGLRAERADTAAWVTNHASLGVSRALGYQDNGTTTRTAEGRRVEQVNLTLRRAGWRRCLRTAPSRVSRRRLLAADRGCRTLFEFAEDVLPECDGRQRWRGAAGVVGLGAGAVDDDVTLPHRQNGMSIGAPACMQVAVGRARGPSSAPGREGVRPGVRRRRFG